MRKTPLEDRFWDLVAKGEPDTCWLWRGSTNGQGYGQVRTGSTKQGNRRMEKAHRIAWTLTHGPIPKGLWVLHSCDNPPCVNPAHLFLGDRSANMRDREEKGRARHPRGMAHGRAKLTDDDVRTIRARYAAGGVTQEALAAEYGVQHPTIGQIVRYKHWRHVR